MSGLKEDMSITFQDPSCSQFSVELVQSLSMVLDPLLRGGSKFGKMCSPMHGKLQHKTPSIFEKHKGKSYKKTC